ncbi:hypothetical protein [Leucobacter sp. M11]|uniref:hypothetical protein n=1 Tax=Leucobacter sp. M11 TaxID=2993565 RepID=UPI002D80CA86|nr:hypothetical protein [Leucobacter sp. M11]MEB4614040.1 hypothetical protein [Leucobacter sp. M11]
MSINTLHRPSRLSVKEAAVIAGRHPDTIREACRLDLLHGKQRVKGGTWQIMPDCLEAWQDNEPCEHRTPKKNVTPISKKRSA